MTDCLYPDSRDFLSWFETDSKTFWDWKWSFSKLIWDWLYDSSHTRSGQSVLLSNHPERIVNLRKLANTHFVIKIFSQILDCPLGRILWVKQNLKNKKKILFQKSIKSNKKVQMMKGYKVPGISSDLLQLSHYVILKLFGVHKLPATRLHPKLGSLTLDLMATIAVCWNS